mgnify:CR=1 FL=1
MDSKNIKSILQDVLEDEMPVTEIDLLPAVQSRLVAGKKSSLRQGETMNQTRMRQLAYSVLAFVTLLAITLATPQGRAFAQKMFQFFAITDEKSFPLPTEMVFPVPETPTKPPAQLLPARRRQRRRVRQSAAGRVGFGRWDHLRAGLRLASGPGFDGLHAVGGPPVAVASLSRRGPPRPTQDQRSPRPTHGFGMKRCS